MTEEVAKNDELHGFKENDTNYEKPNTTQHNPDYQSDKPFSTIEDEELNIKFEPMDLIEELDEDEGIIESFAPMETEENEETLKIKDEPSDSNCEPHSTSIEILKENSDVITVKAHAEHRSEELFFLQNLQKKDDKNTYLKPKKTFLIQNLDKKPIQLKKPHELKSHLLDPETILNQNYIEKPPFKIFSSVPQVKITSALSLVNSKQHTKSPVLAQQSPNNVNAMKIVRVTKALYSDAKAAAPNAASKPQQYIIPKLRNNRSIEAVHSRSSMLKCPFEGTCGIFFGSSEELNVHLNLHRANKCFCSFKCSQYFDKLEDCLLHEFTFHNRRNIKCYICAHKFVTCRDFKEHLPLHKTITRHVCSLCREWYMTNWELYDHWKQSVDTCGKAMKNLIPKSYSPDDGKNKLFAARFNFKNVLQKQVKVVEEQQAAKKRKIDELSDDEERKTLEYALNEMASKKSQRKSQLQQIKQEPIDVPFKVKEEPLDMDESAIFFNNHAALGFKVKEEPMDSNDNEGLTFKVKEEPIDFDEHENATLSFKVKEEPTDSHNQPLAVKIKAEPIEPSDIERHDFDIHNVKAEEIELGDYELETEATSLVQTAISDIVKTEPTLTEQDVVPNGLPVNPAESSITSTSFKNKFIPIESAAAFQVNGTVVNLLPSLKLRQLPKKDDTPKIQQMKPAANIQKPFKIIRLNANGTVKLPLQTSITTTTASTVKVPAKSPTSSISIMKLPVQSPTSSFSKVKLPTTSPTSSLIVSKLPTVSAPANVNLPAQSPTSSNSIFKLPAQSPTSSNSIFKLPAQSPTSANSILKLPVQSATSSNLSFKFPAQSPTSANSISKFPSKSPPSSISIMKLPMQTIISSVVNSSMPVATPTIITNVPAFLNRPPVLQNRSTDSITAPAIELNQPILPISKLSCAEACKAIDKKIATTSVDKLSEDDLMDLVREYCEVSAQANRNLVLPNNVLTAIEKFPDKKELIQKMLKDIDAAKSAKQRNVVGSELSAEQEMTSIKNVAVPAEVMPPTLYLPASAAVDVEIVNATQDYPDFKYFWICPRCGRQYMQKFAFRSHLVVIHGLSHPELDEQICEVKPVRYKAVNEINNKKLIPQQSVFACEKCGNKYSTRTMLTDHMAADCSRNPQYACLVCGKKFYSHHTLVIHKTIHTGELPHKCSYCDKRFRTRGQVTVHHRTHTGERPFVCQVCSQGFTHRETLISHISRHIGIKRYKCYGCNHTFSCISGLKTHRSLRPDTCGKIKLNSRAVGPRVRVVRGNVYFEPQPEINPYLRTSDPPTDISAETQNQTEHNTESESEIPMKTN